MTIDRIEAKCGEGPKALSMNDHVNAEAYSDSSMRVFQKCGVGRREEANLDFNVNNIYKDGGAADKNESNEGARQTPLAAQQRAERLAANKDVQQTQGEKVANGDKPSNFQSPRVEGKDNEMNEAERVTPLARAQREHRLANNPNLKSW